MAEKEIIVDCAPTGGTSQISVKGVKGKACTKLTENLEKAMGRKIRSTPTAEMNQVETNLNRLRA